MKKVFIIITAIISIISCTNLDEVWNELRDHEERIQKLETLCNKLNSNIEAMPAVLMVRFRRSASARLRTGSTIGLQTGNG